MADVALSTPPGMPSNGEPHAGEVDEMMCKGCGDILEEGKAFELAGNRWHIDCFRCTTCGSPLDSDANLLLLGDGSLLCNNCTYNCAACGNKIEDLAILTGDQAFCSTCFKCRNCKRDIENLRYARTSQGIFCMDCHQKLMTRRRKKKAEAREQLPRTDSNSSGNLTVEKSLPALPPKSPMNPTFLADQNEAPFHTPSERSPQPPLSATSNSSYETSRQPNSATSNVDHSKVPPVSSHYSDYSSATIKDADLGKMNEEDLFVTIGFDPSPGPFPPAARQQNEQRISPDLPARSNARDYFGDYNDKQKQLRSNSSDRDAGKLRTPHIASYEKGRQSSGDMAEALRRRRDANNSSSGTPQASVSAAAAAAAATPLAPLAPPERSRSRQNALPPAETGENFKLQDAPKSKDQSSSQILSLAANIAQQPSASPAVGSTISVTRSRHNSTSNSPTVGSSSFEKPLREDSLGANKSIPRKEIPRSNGEISVESTPKSASNNRPFASRLPQTEDHPVKALDIPGTRSVIDEVPIRSPFRNVSQNRDGNAAGQALPTPITPSRSRGNESVSTKVSDQAGGQEPSTALPAYGSAGAFTMDDEMNKNLGVDGQQDEATESGLLRKMSKVVKHNRSQSDRLSMTAPGKIKNGRSGSVDISSPVNVTPDSKEEASALRSKLRYAQQRIVDLEAEKNALQEKVDGSADMRQVTSELREKRSTVAFLATQQELVSRELEVMTDQINRARNSDEPWDIEQLKSNVLRDFAIALNNVKESLGVQIRELFVEKNGLTAEISNLIQMKDKGFQEYESLSTKNQQLSELNAHLIQNIQELHRAGKGPPLNLNVNGLGIYSNIGGENRSGSDPAFPTSMSNETEADSATIIAAPKVVDLRKGQVKKFNWKKGGRDLTTGIRQGLKGAFQSDKASMPKEEQFTETTPYSSLQAGDTPVSGPTPMGSRGGLDGRKDTWGFLTPREKAPYNQKGGVGPAGGHAKDSNVAGGETIFGTDLTARCEYEKRLIPTIVSRCIEEVELRGITAEGIYRKSGSSLQVKSIQQNFEKDALKCDISDPDLDIHAVTSCLKQYFRKLPVPLITYDVYDPLLERAKFINGANKEEAIRGVRDVIDMLPRCHRDTLEFLIFHLVRVMERENENLMTALNLSVVFAPTILKPQSIEREMSDMHAQRIVVQALLEHHNVIFSGGIGDEVNSVAGSTLAGSITTPSTATGHEPL